MSPVETLLAEPLARARCADMHGALPDYATCHACTSWAAHVAAEQAKALMTMLEESGIDRQMQGCLSGFDCAHDDSDACADALAAAMADLIGGAR